MGESLGAIVCVPAIDVFAKRNIFNRLFIIFIAMKKNLFIFLILSIGHTVYAQDLPHIPEELKISIEFRPRAELRNGYRHLRNDTTRAAFFTSQ